VPQACGQQGLGQPGRESSVDLWILDDTARPTLPATFASVGRWMSENWKRRRLFRSLQAMEGQA
jgi:hypothetical protein